MKSFSAYLEIRALQHDHLLSIHYYNHLMDTILIFKAHEIPLVMPYRLSSAVH